MKSFKQFFSLSWNPVDFGSFLPFGTHGRCFDRGLGKRQRPEVFSGRERSFLRSGSFLRLSDHEIVWCTMRTRKCFIIALFDFASYCLGLYFIINSTISSIFFWRTSPPVSFNIFSFDQHSSGLEVFQAKSAALLRTKKKFVRGWEIAAPTIHASKQFFGLFLKLRFNLMQSLAGLRLMRKLRLSW